MGIVGFVRKVVLFGFCLLGVQRVRYTVSIYSSDRCSYIDVAGVWGDKVQ